MFEAEELVFIANLINAAIPSAVQNAQDVRNVDHILNKIGALIQENSDKSNGGDEED